MLQRNSLISKIILLPCEMSTDDLRIHMSLDDIVGMTRSQHRFSDYSERGRDNSHSSDEEFMNTSHTENNSRNTVPKIELNCTADDITHLDDTFHNNIQKTIEDSDVVVVLDSDEEIEQPSYTSNSPLLVNNLQRNRYQSRSRENISNTSFNGSIKRIPSLLDINTSPPSNWQNNRSRSRSRSRSRNRFRSRSQSQSYRTLTENNLLEFDRTNHNDRRSSSVFTNRSFNVGNMSNGFSWNQSNNNFQRSRSIEPFNRESSVFSNISNVSRHTSGNVFRPSGNVSTPSFRNVYSRPSFGNGSRASFRNVSRYTYENDHRHSYGNFSRPSNYSCYNYQQSKNRYQQPMRQNNYYKSNHYGSYRPNRYQNYNNFKTNHEYRRPHHARNRYNRRPFNYRRPFYYRHDQRTDMTPEFQDALKNNNYSNRRNERNRINYDIQINDNTGKTISDRIFESLRYT